MGSPAIFAGSRTKLLSSQGLSLKSNAIVDNDGPVNFITNGHAEINTTGWATYFNSNAVTFQDAGDTVTLSNHGIANGTPIAFTVITTTTGISINTTYYVISATTNTFQVASTAGGSALPLTTDGTGTLVISYPVNGTGGSPNITWTRTTTTPLAGTASFLFTKDAASRMGQGTAFAFTLTSAYQARVMNISFDYIVASGTFAAGSQTALSDITVYIYDVTNSVLIQPSNFKIMGSSTSVANTMSATFQTSPNGTSYRLILHCSTTSASAYTVEFDNVVVTPANYTYGTPVTDWVAYTPGAATQGFGTLASVDLYYRRVGGDLEIRGSFTTGTTTATEARLALPQGLTSSTDVNQNTQIGVYGRGANSSNHGGLVVKQNAVNYILFSDSSTFSNTAVISTNPANGSSVAGTGEKISFQASVPITGWASNVQIADPFSNRLITARYTKSSAQTVTSNTIINFDSLSSGWDTAAAVTTGASWKFTAPIFGYYRIHAMVGSSGTNVPLAVYKNGVLHSQVSAVTPVAGGPNLFQSEISAIVSMSAGDYIDVRSLTVGGGGSAVYTTASQCYCEVDLLTNPSITAQNPIVYAGYYMSANFAATASNPLNFDTKIDAFSDTNAAVTTGASWKFTAPNTGYYMICGFINYASALGTNFLIWKNGAANRTISYDNATMDEGFSASMYLVAGDYIDIRPTTNATALGGLLSSAGVCHIEIQKIG